jgi:hypothetical protein
MSELKVDKVSPRSGNYVSLNTVGMKNIIINGDMSIAQRSTSVASITSDGYNTVDRFEITRIQVKVLGHNHNQLMFQLVKVLQHH